MLAVDLERVEGLVAASVTRRLEAGERTVGKARQKEACVVDPDWLDFAGEIVHPLLDEGLRHRGDFIDAAVEPQGSVDAMRQQIARDPASRDPHVEPPQSRSALGEVFGNGPVLKELRAIMIDASEPPLVDELLGER